ncbi:MAG TPA: thioredoxin domain-containing protein [Solirubrobacterales bacterium]|nr:thioredoxin domain-containing protein [Solirubrobacterales bacterium]
MEADPRRRQRLLQIAAGAAFLALAAVLVLIVVNSSGNDDPSGGGNTKLEGVAEINRSLAGYPQEGSVIGDTSAPVETVEYGDLQCPVCKHYAEDIIPPVLENQVKKGQTFIDFRYMVVVGDESIAAGAAAHAAGLQHRSWNFIEIFYRNQGEENSGYADDDEFLEAVAKAAGVKDLDKWNEDRANLTEWVEENTEEAHNVGLHGTPSFTVRGPKSNFELKVVGTPDSTEALEEAIDSVR